MQTYLRSLIRNWKNLRLYSKEGEANMENKSVNGTLIWYYYICKREVWLMARNLGPDQENSNIDFGRFLQEQAYQREKKEVSIGNIKLDILKKEKGQLIVGEVKKSSKFLDSARMQLAFYLHELEQKGISATGVLMFPKEKKREEILLTDDLRNELDKTINDVLRIMYEPKPQPPEKISYCRNCGYNEFCWA